MFDDLFDSPWKILIVAVVIIVLFGSRKLPDAARSLGRSMRILRTEIQGGLDGDESGAPGAQGTPGTLAAPTTATVVQAAPAPPAEPQAPSTATDPQAQIAALQEQLDNLQRTVAANAAAAAESQQPH